MTHISNVDVEIEPDVELRRREHGAKEPSRSRSMPIIALGLMLLPLNAGILLYTAKNAADVRESRETLSALKRSIDGLKQQISKQAVNIASGAKADDMAAVRKSVEELQKDVADLDGRMGTSMFASSGSMIISAPGKEVTQRLAPSSYSVSAPESAVDDVLAAADPQGGSIANLPRYERTVSADGKLVLRKVR
ncbi:hypothetical protein [Sinorhizobium sp. NFACC03]|uniref:hypothetical protein n=1 Tax=Sinorhizobium sp. NFACC03 TaxID=1566295 RepID=UPI0008860119|nr:hypothetical protein [Sinorhizobium sp. NFACC03]SDA90645.1 hypothetical protein SAMN03159448_04433 [Sinorhizobium sp. NFACC03]